MESPKDEPISFQSLNIPTIPERVRLTIFGKVRAFSTFTIFEWIYVSISLVGLATSFGLSIQRIFVHDLDTSDFTFAILLLFTIVFCVYYVIDSVLSEKAYELMVFVISNTIVLIYCIANYVTQGGNVIKMVRLIIVCILSPFLIGGGIFQSVKYCQSNHLIFNTVGGNSDLQKACKLFYLCGSLLKFDFQLQVSMLILVMGVKGSDMDLLQKVILGSGIPITAIFVVIGFLGLKRENMSLMAAFYVLGLLEPAYIVYKFYYTATNEAHVSGKDNATYESTFACGCFALAVWIGLITVTGYFCTHHFGKGLKEKIFESENAVAAGSGESR